MTIFILARVRKVCFSTLALSYVSRKGVNVWRCLRELARNKFNSPPRNSEWAGNFPPQGRPSPPSPRRVSVSFLALSGPELIASSPQAAAAAEAAEGGGAGSLECLLLFALQSVLNVVSSFKQNEMAPSALRSNWRLKSLQHPKTISASCHHSTNPPGATFSAVGRPVLCVEFLVGCCSEK